MDTSRSASDGADWSNASDLFKYFMEAFGCHLKWAELQNIDPRTLDREKEILAKDEWDFNTRPTYFTAVRNLQGYVAYKLEEEEEAVAFFKEVLDNDPNNINALGNLLFIDTENGKRDSARGYEVSLREVFDGKNYEHRARAYADRSHAIRYFEQDKRRFHYMEYIERACVIGSSCITSCRAEWFFDLGLALYRKDVQMLYLRRLWSENGIAKHKEHDLSKLDAKIRVGFVKAANCFYDVIKISEADDIKALSWVFLGILLSHDPTRRNYAEVFTDACHELHAIDAERCYSRGLELGEEHAITLRRVGAEYVKLGRYDEAKELLEKSLMLLKSWFAYRHMGLMYLAMYDKNRPDADNLSILKEAEASFKKALTLKKVHADYSDLGWVYFLSRQYDKAITQYKMATKNDQDDFFDLVKTHKRWAECLKAQREYHGQQEQEKRASELKKKLHEPIPSKDDFFRDDFEFYSAPTKPGFVRILLGTHIWCTDSQRTAAELGRYMICGDDGASLVQRYRYDFFVSYAERDRRWTFAFLHKLESEHSLRGCINHRDFVPGEDESVNRVKAIRNCFKCITIWTPAYFERESDQEPQWTGFELKHAITESLRRPDGYIIPIMLRRCTPCASIEHLTYRQCCDGQFAQEHWDELVSLLSANRQ